MKNRKRNYKRTVTEEIRKKLKRNRGESKEKRKKYEEMNRNMEKRQKRNREEREKKCLHVLRFVF